MLWNKYKLNLDHKKIEKNIRFSLNLSKPNLSKICKFYVKFFSNNFQNS